MLGAAAFADGASPLNVEAGFFGINAERPHEDVYNSDILAASEAYSGSYSIEATVSISETSTANGTAGLIVGSGGADEDFYYFGIYPNEDKWKLFDPGFGEPLEAAYDFALSPQPYNLKMTVEENLVTVFINGVAVGSSTGALPVSGGAGLRIRNTDSQFSGVCLNGLPQDLSGWSPGHSVAWSGIAGDAVRGSVLLDPVLLSSPELSPKLETQFRMMAASGARSVRFMLSWAEIQPQGPGQQYSWRYADAFAIAAQRHGLEIVPVTIFAPRWAVAQSARDSRVYHAYPPVDAGGNLVTAGFSQFTAAAANRYKRGGELAVLMGWSTGGFGQAGYFEVGPEFNLGTVHGKEDGVWREIGAAWLGDLAQYVDLLKAGRDAVKSACPDCLVLNGAAADDSIPNYSIGGDAGRYDGYEPYLDDLRLQNPDGTLAWRQTLWQGVEDLYDEIARRPPPDNVPGRYFDVLNIHTYMWKGFTEAMPVTADRYVSCSFYSSDCWRRWYETRLAEVTRVMRAHGDVRDIWLTETGIPGTGAAIHNGGFYGFLSEDKQARALETAYSEASHFPAVKRVFWWHGYESAYTGRLGLIREDLSAKPAYGKYSWLAGQSSTFRSSQFFAWYDNVGAANWILMANPAAAAGDAWFDVSIAGREQALPATGGLAPGRVPAGGVLSARFPNAIGGPVIAAHDSPSEILSSQRILWAENSLEEVIGTDATRLSDHFFWSWYDELSPGFRNWVLVANPAAATVYYRIRIAGSVAASGSIDAGASVAGHFPGMMGGPVEVQAWSDTVDGIVPAEVMASQRVLSNGGTAAFNEVPGIPAVELSDHYFWTWYDMSSNGAENWVLIANPPESGEIYYEIRIGGAIKETGGPIFAGKNETAVFPGIMGGPVEVSTFSDAAHSIPAKAIATQRVIWGPSFEEVPGYPAPALASSYNWTWYDESGSFVRNWILVANPSSSRTVWYRISIAGSAMGGCNELGPGGRATPHFSGVVSGPVEVRAYDDGACGTPASGGAIMSSQRVLWKGYFNEVPGVVLD